MRCEAAITVHVNMWQVKTDFHFHNTSKSKGTKNGKLTSLFWSTIRIPVHVHTYNGWLAKHMYEKQGFMQDFGFGGVGGIPKFGVDAEGML